MDNSVIPTYSYQNEALQYAKPAKSILFLARLEFICKAGYVVHYFQHKICHVHIFRLKLEHEILSCQIVECCLVLYGHIA